MVATMAPSRRAPGSVSPRTRGSTSRTVRSAHRPGARIPVTSSQWADADQTHPAGVSNARRRQQATNELLADVIYIWSIQYYANYDIRDRYRYLEHIYGRVISELDPHYLDPYLIGALIMNLEAKDPEMALRLLDKGIANNPDHWILPFEAGFLCYNDLEDYIRASRYFEVALRRPGVHPLVRRFYAEMHNRAGDKRTSLREWMEILETSEDEYVRNVAWKHVRELKIAVDLNDITLGALV